MQIMIKQKDIEIKAPYWRSPSTVALSSNGARSITVDPTSKIIYVTDYNNHRILAVDPSTGLETTVAGSSPGYANGIGTNALFNNPLNAVADGNGHLFVVRSICMLNCSELFHLVLFVRLSRMRCVEFN
jgi:DNA-binding beta-propeller fold protein YncE